jgi:PhnB protein
MDKSFGNLPENTSIIIPRLVCRDPASEVDFCVRACEAVELNKRSGPDGTLAHALLKIGPEMIMIEAEWPSVPSRAPTPDATSPVVIFVYVADVDKVVERATAVGASTRPRRNARSGGIKSWPKAALRRPA